MFSRQWWTYFLIILLDIVYIGVNLFCFFGPAILGGFVSPWFFALYIITGPAFIATMLCMNKK